MKVINLLCSYLVPEYWKLRQEEQELLLRFYPFVPKSWEQRKEERKRLQQLRKEWKKRLKQASPHIVKTMAKCQQRSAGHLRQRGFGG